MTTPNDLPSVGTEECDHGMPTDLYCDACTIDKLMAERDELASRVSELEAEVLDQCRLNGMGAERESALMGRVRELEGAALAAQPGSVGEWKRVPVVPTEAMIAAIYGGGMANLSEFDLRRIRTQAKLDWAAMLAAAPTEAKPAQDAVDATFLRRLTNARNLVDRGMWVEGAQVLDELIAAISAKKGGAA